VIGKVTSGKLGQRKSRFCHGKLDQAFRLRLRSTLRERPQRLLETAHLIHPRLVRVRLCGKPETDSDSSKGRHFSNVQTLNEVCRCLSREIRQRTTIFSYSILHLRLQIVKVLNKHGWRLVSQSCAIRQIKSTALRITASDTSQYNAVVAIFLWPIKR
jgi:hypothetical protein